jgi:hypothetical protein
MIKETRGRHKIVEGNKNREAVMAFYIDNPDGLQKECELATGLSPITVRLHMRALGLKK